MNISNSLRLLSFAFLSLAVSTSEGAMVVTFFGGGPADASDPDPTVFNISNLNTATPTVGGLTGDGGDPNASAAGAIGPGISGQIGITVEPGTFSPAGNSIGSITTNKLASNNSQGWSILGGTSEIDAGEILAFTFDLSGAVLGPNTTLRLTSFTLGSASNTDITFYVDGLSATSFTGINTGNVVSPNTVITDGTRVGWTLDSGAAYRLRSVTLESTVPEPSGIALAMMALLIPVGLCIHRKRSAKTVAAN